MTPDEFDNEIAQLEVNLDRLRALYEQYFLGIERIEPSVARKTVDRQFWMLKRVVVRNTARRFRFQTLVQRYNTLQQHWMKVCRQIENGTYVRHLQRAKRRNEENALTIAAKKRFKNAPGAGDTAEARPSSAPLEPAAPRQSVEPPALSDGTPTSRRPSARVKDRPPASSKRISLVPIDNELAQKIRNSAPPLPSSAQKRPPPLNRAAKPMQTPVASPQNKPSPPPTAYDGPITEERVGGLYQELQRVRRRLNQTEMDVSLEALARSLRATEARLKAKYEGKRVDFRVEVFNGKAVIKPSVKR